MSKAAATAGQATAGDTTQKTETTQTQGAADPKAGEGAATAATSATAAGKTEGDKSKDATKEGAEGSMVTDPPAADPKKDEKDPKEAKPGVPEKYDLKLPDGSKADASYLEKVASLAKEKGWSNERAQEYIDDRHAAVTEYQQSEQQNLQMLNSKTWKEELMNDPDFGGKAFEANGHLAYKAAERFGGKEFADEMKAMQLNHHPKFFRFLVRVGRAMESDQFVQSNQNSVQKKPAEEIWYPNMKKG